MHAISQESRFYVSETFESYNSHHININCIISKPIIDRLIGMIYRLVKFFTTTQGPARPALRGATFKHI